jgi:8-oxo-dGTP pyrophosphatase MutT (NUDIX family)
MGAQMYKVFYNNSAIFIGEELTSGKIKEQLIRLRYKKEVFQFLDGFFKHERPADFYLSGYHVNELFEDFKSYFQYMEAAGGLVTNDMQQYLFIRRFGIWDLPKGKMKKSELPEDTAIREVEEETMVSGLSLLDELPSTFHIYPFNNSLILKKTYWFSMSTKSKKVLVPQQEEDITEAVWLDKEKSKAAIGSGYRSLKENFLSFFQD